MASLQFAGGRLSLFRLFAYGLEMEEEPDITVLRSLL
jgi:hypothetical protein